MRTARICVFGDSITWGAFDELKGGWAERLKIHFIEQEDEDYAEVFNLGLPGTKSTDLLKRIEVECENRGPDIVLISIGINDSQFLKTQNKTRTTLEEFRENLGKLCEKASQFAEKIAFIGLSGVEEEKTMPVYWNSDCFYGNENIMKYDAEIERFCLEKNQKYISLSGILKNGDWEDGLHPNANGHEKIFQKIVPEVLKDFQEIKNNFS